MTAAPCQEDATALSQIGFEGGGKAAARATRASALGGEAREQFLFI